MTQPTTQIIVTTTNPAIIANGSVSPSQTHTIRVIEPYGEHGVCHYVPAEYVEESVEAFTNVAQQQGFSVVVTQA